MDTPGDRILRVVAYMRQPGISADQQFRARESLEVLAAEAGITVAEALAPASEREMCSKALICAHPTDDAEVSTFPPEADQPPEDAAADEAEPNDAALEQGVSTSARATKVAAVAEAIRANPELSDRAIARACGVSPTTAGRVRMRLESSNAERS